ncbi:hypothetical protein LPJ61_001747 [Coemansia biformis]|uniref:Uncharacterized protein n=1 Tax=Coemansia biformis TaxID=1286918 RepID=A0A9W7YEL2_9FUNG|nr:hypothetical protein LPJ61_001747 [Coemansia biformis]
MMDSADSKQTPAGPISIEQLRAAFGSGSPAVVHDMLVPFLQQESRSNGDMRVINEIAESTAKLLYPWFQDSGTMSGSNQRALYALLRPDGRLVDTLLQYHILQRQHVAAMGAMPAAGSSGMTLPLLSLPVEYHVLKGVDVGRAMSLPADFARRLVADGAAGTAGFVVGALEYFLYHFCKALVPPRGPAVRGLDTTVAFLPASPGASSAQHGTAAAGSVAHYLAREYIGFFMPVAVPERLVAERSGPATERSPMRHIRDRLHDFSPRKGAGVAPDERDNERRPGTTDTDILDGCDYVQSLGLASFFVSCAALLWLPVVPMDVLAAVRSTLQSADSARREHGGGPDGVGSWVWIPSPSQLSALHLFHLLVGYLAKGERQLERYHLAGSAAPHDGGHAGPGREAGGSDMAACGSEAYDKRIGMNGTVRDTLRTHCLNVAVADALGLVLASCGQAGFLDSDIWIPFLDVTTSIWLRYAMPWRGARTEAVRGGAQEGGGAEISPLWRSRIPLMMKCLPPALYGPALAVFLQQMSSPNVDLLVHTSAGHRGGSRASHGVQTWIHDAVSSVFGHTHTMDVLAVIERVAGAFTGTELRAILAAAERYQLEAFPRHREQTALPTPLQPSTLGMAAAAAAGSAGAMETPTKKAPAGRQTAGSTDSSLFERQVAAAEKLIAPYAQAVVSFRSGSALLDATMVGVLGRPPVCVVFSRGPSALLRRIVDALRGAEVLAERQLRLIIPEGSADQARSVVSDIFLVLSRLFSAPADDGPGAPWGWAGAGRTGAAQSGGAGETMRARAQSLHEAQARIRTLYARLATVFGASRSDMEALTMAHDDTMISAASAGGDGGRAGQPFGSSGSFGERLAARGRQGGDSGGSGLGTPDMEHGSLTPRGRWELKTGRKKFTTQSLLGSPLAGQPQPPTPPEWGLQARRKAPRPDAALDATLLPRGPRAHYEARSYESQWLLDRVLVFNEWANRQYQLLLDVVGAGACPIPEAVRTYKLDFRWVAAYQNIRFALLVLLALRLICWLLF